MANRVEKHANKGNHEASAFCDSVGKYDACVRRAAMTLRVRVLHFNKRELHLGNSPNAPCQSRTSLRCEECSSWLQGAIKIHQYKL